MATIPFEFKQIVGLRNDTIQGISLANLKTGEDENALEDMDLNNYSVKMQIRDKSGLLYHDFSIGQGLKQVEDHSLLVEPFIINKEGFYKYDIQFTNNITNEVNTFYFGTILIQKDISKTNS